MAKQPIRKTSSIPAIPPPPPDDDKRIDEDIASALVAASPPPVFVGAPPTPALDELKARAAVPGAYTPNPFVIPEPLANLGKAPTPSGKQGKSLHAGQTVFVEEAHGHAVNRRGIVLRQGANAWWIKLDARAESKKAHLFGEDDGFGRELLVEVGAASCLEVEGGEAKVVCPKCGTVVLAPVPA